MPSLAAPLRVRRARNPKGPTAGVRVEERPDIGRFVAQVMIPPGGITLDRVEITSRDDIGALLLMFYCRALLRRRPARPGLPHRRA